MEKYVGILCKTDQERDRVKNQYSRCIVNKVTDHVNLQTGRKRFVGWLVQFPLKQSINQ